MGIDHVKDRLARLLPDGLRAFVAARTKSHRRFVGPADRFDLFGASQFGLLTLLGLREDHYLLDVGCGSLRAGRLFITYLQPGHYFAIEPERWLVESALRNELGREMARIKHPVFDHNDAFRLTVFGRRFDFLLASSIFSHATQQQVRTCVGEAAQVMTPSGLFLASFYATERNSTVDTWQYPGRVGYSLDWLREVAAEHGLACEPLDWPYAYGTGSQTWLALAPVYGGEAR
jgi:hypothetical protein